MSALEVRIKNWTMRLFDLRKIVTLPRFDEETECLYNKKEKRRSA